MTMKMALAALTLALAVPSRMGKPAFKYER